MAVRNFDILLKNDYFPTFQQPIIIGFFDLDNNRQFCASCVNLKYLYRIDPRMKLNLNEGFEQYIPKKENLENVEKIDSLLLWIYHRRFLKNIINPRESRCTFICYRGLLTTIMRTPYEQQESWFIAATKVKNMIFLCAFYTDEKKRKMKQGKTNKERRFEYWGYKFEQFLMTNDPTKKPNSLIPVNANEEFNVVYRSKLNQHYLIYGAETDGIDSHKLIDMNFRINSSNYVDFVELKTSRFVDTENQDRNFKKFKLLKWWSQSFVVGIENIICGFRDDNGIVHDITNFKTKDLPKIADKIWSPCVCMRFLDDFLSFVKDTVGRESDLSQWRYDWKPTWKHIASQKMSCSTENWILPNWFLNECTKYESNFT